MKLYDSVWNDHMLVQVGIWCRYNDNENFVGWFMNNGICETFYYQTFAQCNN